MTVVRFLLLAGLLALTSGIIIGAFTWGSRKWSALLQVPGLLSNSLVIFELLPEAKELEASLLACIIAFLFLVIIQWGVVFAFNLLWDISTYNRKKG